MNAGETLANDRRQAINRAEDARERFKVAVSEWTLTRLALFSDVVSAFAQGTFRRDSGGQVYAEGQPVDSAVTLGRYPYTLKTPRGLEKLREELAEATREMADALACLGEIEQFLEHQDREP